MTIKEKLTKDPARNLGDYRPRSIWHKIALCLVLNSVHAVLLIRFQEWLAHHRLPTFPAAKMLFYLFKSEISRHASIGAGLRLPHPMGIIIAPRVTLGDNCDLYAEVRLVLAHGDRQGPVIGDHVFLGDGAKVVGNVQAGDHSVIGVSSVVTKSHPSGVNAVGIPARIIQENNQREEDRR